MLTTEQINDLHRLYWSDHWPIRKIERHLHMGWETIKKYLDMPAQTPAGRPRSSKLDPYKATIAELLEKDPSASAAVIGQRLQPLGYTGGDSILRQYVHEVRPQSKPQRAFVRMEPKPGERFEVEVTGDPCCLTTFKKLHPESVEAGLVRNPGIVATALHCVNAIPYVCAAAPGLLTYLDLPLVAGRASPGLHRNRS